MVDEKSRDNGMPRLFKAAAFRFKSLPPAPAADRRGDDLDLRHHASVLVFENMTVVDELTDLGERNVDHDRR